MWWTERAVLLSCAAAVALSACGFQLRGGGGSGDGLRGALVHTVNAPPALARALSLALAENGATVSPTAAAAAAVLHVAGVDHRRDISVLDNSGKAAAYRLSLVVTFRIQGAPLQNKKNMPQQQITVTRHLDHAGRRVLQSDNEENFTRGRMMLEAARRMVRRIGRVIERAGPAR
ncbi:MAG: LPS assembly lipoprotein LptE [Gammaproteobacteria bacterium]|nr:LPS assembly lipoprotein LptE [Gammaproteobacteria bacterium]